MSVDKIRGALRRMLGGPQPMAVAMSGPRPSAPMGFRVLDYAAQEIEADQPTQAGLTRQLRAGWAAAMVGSSALLAYGLGQEALVTPGDSNYRQLLASVDVPGSRQLPDVVSEVIRDNWARSDQQARETLGDVGPLGALRSLGGASHVLYFTADSEGSADVRDPAVDCLQDLRVSHCRVTLGPLDAEAMDARSARGQLNVFLVSQAAALGTLAQPAPAAPEAVDHEEIAYGLYLRQAQADAFGIAHLRYRGAVDGARTSEIEMSAYSIMAVRQQALSGDPIRRTPEAVQTAISSIRIDDLVQGHLDLLAAGAEPEQLAAHDARAAAVLLDRSRLAELRAADAGVVLDRGAWAQQARAALASGALSRLATGVAPLAERIGVPVDAAAIHRTEQLHRAAATAREVQGMGRVQELKKAVLANQVVIQQADESGPTFR